MPELNSVKIFASYYYHNMGFNITHISPEFNIKRDRNNSVKKNPYKSSSNNRTNFEFFRQAFTELESYDWVNAKGIGTVAGFNGLRALDFDKVADWKAIDIVLELLNLPPNYEWVVKSGSQNGFHVIFYCSNFEFAGYRRRLKRYFPNLRNSKLFKCIDFIWFNHLILPPSMHKTGNQYQFQFCEYPLHRPALIETYQVRNLLNELCYQFGGYNIIKPEKTSEIYYDVPIIDSPVIIDNDEYNAFLNSKNNLPKNQIKNDQLEYYKQNAKTLDKVYSKEQYKLGLNKIVETIKSFLGNLSVLEIACGNGYWTKHIHNYAKELLATDYNDECLREAKLNLKNKSIIFEIQDALNIKSKKKYDAIFGGFILSHIEKDKLHHFFNSIHDGVKQNGKIMLIDNTQAFENNMETDFTDPNGNTYQKRNSVNGNAYWIIKNFPNYNELKSILEDVAYDIEYTKLKYFWVLTYKLK